MSLSLFLLLLAVIVLVGIIAISALRRADRLRDEVGEMKDELREEARRVREKLDKLEGRE